MRHRSSVGIAILAGAGLPVAATAQLRFVSNIPGSFTDITGNSLRLFPSTEYQTFAPTTLGPREANLAFPEGDVFVSIYGTLGYSVSVDIHNVNTALPSPDFYMGSRAAAVYWDDLEHTLSGAGVYSAEITENGVPVRIFQWEQLDHTPGTSGHATFEMKIFGGGRGPGGALAQYLYQSTNFGNPALNSGASATVGFQSSGASAVQYSFNAASVPDGTVLSLVVGGPTGSCCIGNEACAIADAATCAGRGGVYHGDGSTCAAAGCVTGACCTPDGCVISSPSVCVAGGGVYHGDGSGCDTSGCAVNLVTNPGFESPSFTQLLPGWWVDPAVNGSHLVRVTEVNPGIAHGGVNYVLFGALLGQPDIISQAVATEAGHQYNLAFWLWAPTPGQNGFQALWNNAVVFDMTPTTAPFGWTRFTATVTAAAPTSLLSMAGHDAIDFIRLDDVTLFDAAATVCYANCDGSTTPPVLNIADFVCFQSLFAAGDPRANCDGSTAAPILNVADFVCFQAAFASGCP
jgi:hypothetical protein